MLSKPCSWKVRAYVLILHFLHLGWLSTQLGTLPDPFLLSPVCTSVSCFCRLTSLLKEVDTGIFFLGNVQGWCYPQSLHVFLSENHPGLILPTSDSHFICLIYLYSVLS